MAITKARKRRPIVYTPQFQDNGPTDERRQHDTITNSSPPRVRQTIQSLLNNGDITQDAANASERWHRDYVFGYHGYAEYPENYIPECNGRHDEVSWACVRANACGRIIDIRRALGMCSHIRLEMLIVKNMSFRDIGREFFPHLSSDTAGKKIASQCMLMLEQLSEFYISEKKELTTGRSKGTKTP